MASKQNWLSDADENSLHGVRLLAIEQRPLQRVFKRLTQFDSPLLKQSSRLPTPPPESEISDSVAETAEVKKNPEELATRHERERQQWRDDMLLDFAALESSMVRIQLLQRSNERERARYAAEKIQIMETAEAIRRTNAELKVQLEQARQTMESRKKYDELANKIFSNKLLKSREEQMQMHEKLQKEIGEQEAEAEEYSRQVEARKAQWSGAIKASLKGMKTIQHPELVKQEEERDAADVDEEAEDTRREGSMPPSRSRSNSREATPMVPDGGEGEEGSSDHLKIPPRSRAASQVGTPAPETQDTKDDVDMTVDVSTPVESVEEGEATDNDLMED